MRRNITLSIMVIAAIAVIIAMFFGVQSSVIRSSFYKNQLSTKASPLLRLIQTIPIPNVNGLLITWL